MPNQNDFQNGANLDTRSEELKALDYTFEEVVASAAPVVWKEKTQEEWRKFQIYNQDGSGSCVAQTARKIIAIMHWLKTGEWINPSASHIYQRRLNKPGGGMGSDDCFKIMQKGTTLNDFALSDGLNDTQMDNILVTPDEFEKGKKYATGNYITVTNRTIDNIASIIQTTGKGVMCWFYWTYDEWLDVPIVKNHNLELYATNTARHSVCAVDFTLYQGKKALIVDESWDKTATALNGQRIITEDFFKERNFYVGYPMNFVFETKHIFNTWMRFGDRNNEVKYLQDFLKTQGVFPVNISSTGYFGAITKKAVIKFQLLHGLKDDGVVGNNTLTVINKL